MTLEHIDPRLPQHAATTNATRAQASALGRIPASFFEIHRLEALVGGIVNGTLCEVDGSWKEIRRSA
jgi:hypothetical protein